jgi:hypothetical protein
MLEPLKDRNAPVEWHVFPIVSVTFQKKATSGRLKVEIIKDGKVAAESETAAEYGVVAVFADAATVDPRGPKSK